MRSSRIEIRLSPSLLKKMDEAARRNLVSRSTYIRGAITMRLNDEHVAPNLQFKDILELLRRSDG